MTRHLICPVCGKEFEATHPRKKYCSKECVREVRLKTSKEFYKHHKDRYIEYHKKYRSKQENREKEKAYRKKYYREHRDYYIQYAKNSYRKKIEYREKMEACKAKHNNCFSCFTKNGECLFD